MMNMYPPSSSSIPDHGDQESSSSSLTWAVSVDFLSSSTKLNWKQNKIISAMSSFYVRGYLFRKSLVYLSSVLSWTSSTMIWVTPWRAVSPSSRLSSTPVVQYNSLVAEDLHRKGQRKHSWNFCKKETLSKPIWQSHFEWIGTKNLENIRSCI